MLFGIVILVCGLWYADRRFRSGLINWADILLCLVCVVGGIGLIVETLRVLGA